MPCWDYGGADGRSSGVTSTIYSPKPIDEQVYRLALWHTLLTHSLGNRAHRTPSECISILNGRIAGCGSTTRLGGLTQSLCAGLTQHQSTTAVRCFLREHSALRIWWERHQEEDRRVAAAKKRRQTRDEARRKALAKLTDAEIEALGIKR